MSERHDAKDVDQILDHVVKRPVGLDKADDGFLIEELQKRGHRVILEPKEGGEGSMRLPVDFDEHQKMKIAVISDTHLGSKWQQLSAYEHFMQEAADEKVELVLHCGDMLDGSYKMHRDMPMHVFKHGLDEQVEYAIETIPDVGIDTYVINGNHDWSFFNDLGANPIKNIAANRKDVHHAGDLGAYVNLGPLTAYIWHPPGGGAYARSYKLQKWVEQQEPTNLPDLVFGGHFHVYNHLGRYGGVESFLVPCFQGQTPYIRRLGLNPVIGGLILELGIQDDGTLVRVKVDKREYDPVLDDY